MSRDQAITSPTILSLALSSSEMCDCDARNPWQHVISFALLFIKIPASGKILISVNKCGQDVPNDRPIRPTYSIKDKQWSLPIQTLFNVLSMRHVIKHLVYEFLYREAIIRNNRAISNNKSF